MADELQAGTDIGGYRVMGLIGQGGMGTVYLVEHLESGRRAALKVLAPELAGDEEFRERFLREWQNASSMGHPHIVKVHEAGRERGLQYQAMDYIPGMDLTMLLAVEGALAPSRALAILGPVANALDAVHAAGILHRDVKPGNVIVATDEAGERPGAAPRPYLTDFGLSKNPVTQARPLTAPDEFVGTSHYVAPEQILSKEPDRRVDIYSLGCLLYECLTAEPPFSGRSDAEVLHAHVEDPPPKASDKRPELPAALDEVIAKAMAKRPIDRYASCSELIADAREATGLPPAGDQAATMSLRLSFGPGSGEATVEVGGSAEPVRLVSEDGRWRFG